MATTALMAAYVFATCLARVLLATVRDQRTVMEVAGSTPPTIMLLIFSFFMAWSLLGLCGYHTLLISRNLTTHEQVLSGIYTLIYRFIVI